MRIPRLRELVIIGVTALVFGGCQRHHTGGPFYFKNTAVLGHKPLKPVNEVSKEEAERLNSDGYSYGVAYFDSAGHLVSYANFQHSIEVWKCEYFYNEKAQFDHEKCRNEDGSIVTRYFDSTGNLRQAKEL